jgi:hypothetical protein
VGAIPTRQLSLQPVAIGAAVEVTRPPKPPVQRVTTGDPASRQAVTRVNAEQASKIIMWEPTLQGEGEGRCRGVFGERTTRTHDPTGVMATACRHRRATATREIPDGGRRASQPATREGRAGLSGKSDRPIVPTKPLIPVEGRGLTSRAFWK